MVGNRQLSLNEVVAVEAWYQEFTADTRETDFFLHIKFQDGVFGAEPEHPVRFKIRLKKANVTIIPEEPIKVPKANVRRDRIQVEAKHTIEERTGKSLSGDVDGSLGISKSGFNTSLNAKASAKASTDKTEHTIKTITHSGMTIEHSTNENQYNCWSFSPASGIHLIGQAFNRNDPIMKLTHKADISKIPPSVKVRVTCLREDIDILELEVKDEHKSFLSRGMGQEKKLKLAEEIIRSALAHNGLEFGDVAEKFAKILVADVIATEE